MKSITKSELLHAQLAILVAVALQLTIVSELRVGPKYFIALLELVLVIAVGITAPRRNSKSAAIHKTTSIVLITIISLANATQLVLITNALIHGSDVPGKSILMGALAIFFTNIIMFGLWYWELDSPGLSGRYDENKDPDFLFPQLESNQLGDWKPTFFDYLYVSITNSTAFSPTDTLPGTHRAKALMSVQSLISLITIVLVTARAVNILG
jgi:uncharacterized membrane protein